MKPFECRGYWWLPGAEADKCPGTLRVNESGELRLSLLGAIVRNPIEGPDQDPSVVHGDVIEFDDPEKVAPKERHVTLHNCLLTDDSFGSSGIHTQSLFAHRAYFGEHILSDKDSLFASLTVFFSGLASWANDLTGFVKRESSHFTISWNRPEPSLTASYRGGELLLGVACSGSYKIREKVLKETVAASLWFKEPVSTTVLERGVVYSLQNFLTFATDHPNALTKLELARERKSERKITVIGPRVCDDENAASDLTPDKLLFTLADVRPRLEDVLRRWHELSERHSSAFDQYFSIQYDPPGFSDLRLQLIVHVLALYYDELRTSNPSWRTTEKPFELATEASRPGLLDTTRVILDNHPLVMAERALAALTERHKEVFGPLIANDSGTGRERFVTAVTDTLRYVLTRKTSGTDSPPSGTDYYWRCEQVAFLWKICLLHELSFTVAEQTALLNRNAKYIHLRDKVRLQLA